MPIELPQSGYFGTISYSKRNVNIRGGNFSKVFRDEITLQSARQSQEVKQALDAFADAASDAIVNYNLQDGQKNNAPEGVRFSIRNTRNMNWDEQIKDALYGNGNITRNDTLIVGEVAGYLTQEGIEQKPLAIPLSVLSKASSGKDISHSIKKGKLAKLDSGIENAPITIVNPARNAIVFVTDIKQGGHLYWWHLTGTPLLMGTTFTKQPAFIYRWTFNSCLKTSRQAQRCILKAKMNLRQ